MHSRAARPEESRASTAKPQIEDRMIRFPISGRSVPRLCRGMSRSVGGLLAVGLCLAACRPPAAPRTNRPPLAREIHGGEVHTYPIELQAGQFLRVVAREDNVHLTIQIFDPRGTLVGAANTLGTEHTEVSEDLAIVAETTGPYRLEVQASAGRSGGYLLRIEEPRAPTEEDRTRVAAVRALWDSLTEKSDENQIRSLERALGLWRQLGDLEKAAEVQFGLGVKRYYSPGGYGESLAAFQQAAEFWRRQPDRKSKVYQVESLTWVGRCLWNLYRPEEARAAHEQAFALARDLGEFGLQAQNLNLLGRLADDEGESRKGVELQLQALEKAQRSGSPETESNVLNNLAISYEHLGEMQETLRCYDRALSLVQSSSNPKAKITFRSNLGVTYRLLGDWDRAFDQYRTALEMINSRGDRDLAGLAATILINLSEVYRHRGELAEARDSLNRALALGRESKNRANQVFALANLALLLRRDQLQQAAALAREAVSLGGTREEQAMSHYALGSVLQDLGDKAAAETELLQALTFAGQRGDHGREAQINFALAHLYRKTGDLDAALRSLQAVTGLFESWRGRVVDPEVKTSFLASTQEVYELQVNTLMARHAQQPAGGSAAEALQVNERARARGLLEILNEAGADIRLGADLALLDKERAVRNEVSAHDSHLKTLLGEENPNIAKVEEAKQKLDMTLKRYHDVQVDLRQSSPRYAALTQPQPLSLGDIQRQVLDGGALLLEYSLGTQKSFLWAVTSDSFASFELPERARIEKVARDYYQLLTVRSRRPTTEERDAADAKVEDVARDLSRLILQPVEPLLGNRPLLIVADGALQYVPFAALPLPSTGDPLVTGHEIVNLPSASVLAVLRRELRDRQPATRTLAIFADPVFQQDDERLLERLGKVKTSQAPSLQPERGVERGEPSLDPFRLPRLRASGEEAETIANLLDPREVFKAVGFAASRATVAGSSLQDFRMIHFATHGVIDSQHPDLSFLALSNYDENGQRHEDGCLRLTDIYSLRLAADLVVLSACQTALGKEIRGEGLIGLTRGFMYAGAARVVASLWKVEDRSTAELMASFYRGMLREGLSPAAALRKAQLETKNKWKRPYFWAGFSLQGEWR